MSRSEIAARLTKCTQQFQGCQLRGHGAYAECVVHVNQSKCVM